MQDESGRPIEWLMPFAFIVCAGWVVWHAPAYLLDFIPPSSESMFAQMSALHLRHDVTPEMAGLFGGFADPIDWAALILAPVLFVIGMRTVRCAPMEFEHWKPIDRFALFFGRITMMLIISMTVIMLYEVLLRYSFEAPTLWANELTLWLAGYVFLFSGFYAMQQRCHIRIFLLYDMVPRWLQHVFDIVSLCFIWFFAILLVFGSYHQVFVKKFYQWEMFGTAFDPPIPATVQPFVLIMVVLIAVQATLNLVNDWNAAPQSHTGIDELDEDELEAIRQAAGAPAGAKG